MKKQYLIIILSLFFMGAWAQGNKLSKCQEGIDGLNFYPNPVNSGKIYVSSKSGLDKEVFIYDVLGKLVMQSLLTTKELNITLTAGVYIIKFKENDCSTTRKLIVR